VSSLDEVKLEILHKHYEDSCSVMGAFRSQRDAYFTRILLLLMLVLYDFYSSRDFGLLVSDLIRQKGGIPDVPDLHYLSTLLWFALLGITVRYCQSAVHLNRQYEYLHGLERQLAPVFGGVAFTREGEAYLASYPIFSSWAHNLYTIAFPVMLGMVAFGRGYRELLIVSSGSTIVIVDVLISIAMLITMVLYVHVLHGSTLNALFRGSSEVSP
jgi:hypothetical protein